MANHSLWHHPSFFRGVRILLMWVFAIMVIMLSLAYYRPQKIKLAKTMEQLHELKAERQKMKDEIQSIENRLIWLKTDPHYLETMARDRLDLARRDEIIVKF
jgi:cell division protein FtsB